MAPRKSTKTPETPEEKSPVTTAVKTRGNKANDSKTSPKPVKSKVVAEATPKPVRGSKPGRKPRVLELVPAPVPEISQVDIQEAPLPESPVVVSAPIPLTPQVQAVLSAIQDGRAVEFLFADADANPPRTFEPRQLVFDVFTKAWFVWGWDRRYNAERHHRIDLLTEVNPVEGVGRAAQGPFKEGTPANQIGGWLGGEPIPVKAVLLKQWIYAVKQAPALFPDFKLEDLEEGKAQVSFVGTDLRAIARWCMQFGDGIQVLEPQRLIDRIKQVGVTWAGKPVQAPPPPQAKPVSEPKAEHHRRSEAPRHESREQHEPREHREPREFRETKETKETESPKSKSGKFEIRIDRL
jgi:hypothetical protein